MTHEESRIHHRRVWTTASLLLLFFLVIHICDDIVRGFEPGDTSTYMGILIAVPMLYASLMLRERLWGYIIVLLFSILGAGVPYIHMTGRGMVGGRVAGTDGMLLWVFTLFASGIIAIFTAILSAQGLWWMWRARSGQ